MRKYKKIYLNEKFFSYNKKRFIFFFLKNFLKFKKFLNIFCCLNVFRYKKNVFLNFSNFFSGNVIYKASCGTFVKRKALRKTFYGVDTLFKNFKIPLKYLNTKYFFFNIRAFLAFRGLKRVLKNYFQNNTSLFNNKLLKINKFSIKAHNGIRKRKKKRK